MSWEANLSAGSSGSERPIEHCADILLRMAGQVPVTDDTMGSEWLHFFGREKPQAQVRTYGAVDSPACIPERPLAPNDGCSSSHLDHWFTDGIAPHSAIAHD